MPKKAKRVSTSTLQDLVVRSLLIVFSVLLALFLDGIREQQMVTANLTTAYRSTRIELESNRDTLNALVEYHRQSVARLDSLLQSRGSIAFTSEFAGVVAQILPEGLLLPDLQNAAWSTMHSTGLLNNLKFEDVYAFTKLYTLQKTGMEAAPTELTKFLSQSERFEKQHQAASLNALRSLLSQLYEQEKHLLNETNTVLNAGQNWRYLE